MEPHPNLTSPLLMGREPRQPRERLTIKRVVKTIWDALTLRDNWQGEFCVSLFGAIGWAITAWMVVEPNGYKRPQQELLDAIAPEWAWQLWFVTFGLMSLHGLRLFTPRAVVWRLAGSAGILVGFVFVFFSLLVTAPWAYAVPMYLSCLMIEFFATIFHTAQLSRGIEGLPWRSIPKR